MIKLVNGYASPQLIKAHKDHLKKLGWTAANKMYEFYGFKPSSNEDEKKEAKPNK